MNSSPIDFQVKLEELGFEMEEMKKKNERERKKLNETIQTQKQMILILIGFFEGFPEILKLRDEKGGHDNQKKIIDVHNQLKLINQRVGGRLIDHDIKEEEIKKKKGVMMFDYSSEKINVKANEIVSIEKEDEEWTYVATEQGLKEYVPTSYINLTQWNNKNPTINSKPKKKEDVMMGIAMYNYEAVESVEISLVENQVVQIIKIDDDWTYVKCATGEDGHVPTSYIQIIKK